MTRPPTAAQRRVIDAAEPGTGRLRGTKAQLAALVERGLAFRHPRPPHDCFLTPAGHRLREADDGADAPAGSAPPAGAPGTASARTSGSGSGSDGVFAARVGGEERPPDAGAAARLREVRGAWQGLLELRRMTRADGSPELPCDWERAHLVRAAALALEAAGHRPAAGADGDGYRVRATPQPEAVAVYEADPDARRACAVTLEAAGWHVGEHTEPRTRVCWLLASPRKV
ncbi:hypothetical protein [Streptomyces sp. SID8352]|uniref:hypothetical protein n=1 Tax=Streptomyces sp. SID8352 TaxID=2690338 RepID=UPI001369EB29|nr:hypothetical protein [Streptomyces sp. SID8352]